LAACAIPGSRKSVKKIKDAEALNTRFFVMVVLLFVSGKYTKFIQGKRRVRHLQAFVMVSGLKLALWPDARGSVGSPQAISHVTAIHVAVCRTPEGNFAAG